MKEESNLYQTLNANHYLTTTEILKYKTIYSDPYKIYHEEEANKSCAQKASWVIEYSWFANIYAFLNIFFSGGAFVVFVLDFLLQDVYVLPDFFSVSVFYTIDFFLTVYVSVDRWTYLTSKYGILDFVTSVPMLILIICQWIFISDAQWAAILPMIDANVSYFICTTLFGLGYGDYTTTTTFGKVFIILLLCFLLYFIPNRVYQLYQAYCKSRFKKNKSEFVNKSNEPTILLCGYMTYDDIKDKLDAMYKTDYENDRYIVIVLSQSLSLDEFKHTKEWEKRYSFRCSILNGNIYNHNDLIRVQMWNTAYILYYPDLKKEAYERDMETLSVLNTLNNAWNSFYDIYIQGKMLADTQTGVDKKKTLCSIKRFQNTQNFKPYIYATMFSCYLTIPSLTLNPIIINQPLLMMHLLAYEILIPCSFSLFYYLFFLHMNDGNKKVTKVEQNAFFFTKYGDEVHQQMTLNGRTSNFLRQLRGHSNWSDEYNEHVGYNLYSIYIFNIQFDIPFGTFAYKVFKERYIYIFALQKPDMKLRVNPVKQLIQEGDILYVFASDREEANSVLYNLQEWQEEDYDDYYITRDLANPPQEEKFPVNVALFSSVLEDNDNVDTIHETEEEQTDKNQTYFKQNPSTQNSTSIQNVVIQGQYHTPSSKNEVADADEEYIDIDNDIDNDIQNTHEIHINDISSQSLATSQLSTIQASTADEFSSISPHPQNSIDLSQESYQQDKNSPINSNSNEISLSTGSSNPTPIPNRKSTDHLQLRHNSDESSDTTIEITSDYSQYTIYEYEGNNAKQNINTPNQRGSHRSGLRNSYASDSGDSYDSSNNTKTNYKKNRNSLRNSSNIKQYSFDILDNETSIYDPDPHTLNELSTTPNYDNEKDTNHYLNQSISKNILSPTDKDNNKHTMKKSKSYSLFSTIFSHQSKNSSNDISKKSSPTNYPYQSTTIDLHTALGSPGTSTSRPSSGITPLPDLTHKISYSNLSPVVPMSKDSNPSLKTLYTTYHSPIQSPPTENTTKETGNQNYTQTSNSFTNIYNSKSSNSEYYNSLKKSYHNSYGTNTGRLSHHNSGYEQQKNESNNSAPSRFMKEVVTSGLKRSAFSSHGSKTTKSNTDTSIPLPQLNTKISNKKVNNKKNLTQKEDNIIIQIDNYENENQKPSYKKSKSLTQLPSLMNQMHHSSSEDNKNKKKNKRSNSFDYTLEEPTLPLYSLKKHTQLKRKLSCYNPIIPSLHSKEIEMKQLLNEDDIIEFNMPYLRPKCTQVDTILILGCVHHLRTLLISLNQGTANCPPPNIIIMSETLLSDFELSEFASLYKGKIKQIEGDITNIKHLREVYNENIDRTLIFPFESWNDDECDIIDKQPLGSHSLSQFDYKTSLALSVLKKLQQEIYNSYTENTNSLLEPTPLNFIAYTHYTNSVSVFYPVFKPQAYNQQEACYNSPSFAAGYLFIEEYLNHLSSLCASFPSNYLALQTLLISDKPRLVEYKVLRKESATIEEFFANTYVNCGLLPIAIKRNRARDNPLPYLYILPPPNAQIESEDTVICITPDL